MGLGEPRQVASHHQGISAWAQILLYMSESKVFKLWSFEFEVRGNLPERTCQTKSEGSEESSIFGA